MINTDFNTPATGGTSGPQTNFSMDDVNGENTKQINNILLQGKLTEQRNLAEAIAKTVKAGSEAVKGLV